ncbi:flippase [soil metagenome]
MSDRAGVGTRLFIQGGAHIGTALCSFATTLVIVHAAGTAGFGEISIGLSVLTYALMISNFGADLHATQVTAHNPAMFGSSMVAVMAIRLTVAIPVLAVIAVLCTMHFWEPVTRIAVGLLSLSVLINVLTPLWAAQALEQAKVIAASTFGAQAFNLLFVILAAVMGWGILGFVLARVAADSLVAIGLSFWVKNQSRKGAPLHASLAFVRRFFFDSAPLAASQILRTMALGSDLLILDFYVSPIAVGVYAVPFRIFMLLLSVTGIYTIVILPTFARRAADGGVALHQTLHQFLFVPFWVLVGGLALIAAATPFFLPRLFGPDFAPGSVSLQLLLVAVAANFLNRCYRCVILASKQRVGDMNSTAIGTVANVGAKLILIPVLGIAGAACGMIFGEVVQCILQRRLAIKSIRALEQSDN